MFFGQIVECGRHRVMCGDAFNPADRAALLGDARPAMLYCDPPYGVNLRADNGFRYRRNVDPRVSGRPKTKPIRPLVGDNKPFNAEPIITAFASVQEQFWFGAERYCESIPRLQQGSWMCWDKRLSDVMDRVHGGCFELIWSRAFHKYHMIRIKWSGLYGTEQEPDTRVRQHPTQKPVVLARWLIERYSASGDVVLDLFAGAGGSLLAAEMAGRTAYCMEIEPDYAELIVNRYQAITQQLSLCKAV